MDDYAMDADRTPEDPEEVAGEFKTDPWDEDPDRTLEPAEIVRALQRYVQLNGPIRGLS